NNGDVKVRVERMEYRVSDRAMVMTAQIGNQTGRPIRLGEFAAANLRFIDAGAGGPVPAETAELVAPTGLQTDSSVPIQPGETRQVRITAFDAGWETERLDGLIRDADSRLGGLLFFFDDAGQRSVASISAAVIPRFD
ncbi:MAG: hypothetical protein RLZZ09_2323, partial [Pseudomonadota bacterium]